MSFSASRGGGGGGGGLHLRSPVDIFADAAARSTAFSAGGTLAGQHVQFASDRSLVIIIGTLASPTFWSYTGDAGAYDDADWLQRTDAVRGPAGNAGAQGIYTVEIFANLGTAPMTAPTGGSVVVATGVVTPPTGWTATESQPAAGEDTYRSRALINPLTQSGTVTPTWGNPVDIRADVSVAAIDARIAPPARANSPSGEFDAARIPDLSANKITSDTLDDARIPSGITRDSEDVAASRITGTLDDSNIPAGITRDTEDIATSRLTGEIADGNIPANIARDTEVTAAIASGVKEFARAGERGVRVGDMDSESATASQVPLADGSAGVAWGDQSVAPTPADQTIRAAISTDTTLEQAEYDVSTSSTTQEITIPTWTAGTRYIFIGVPEAQNDITDIDQNGISEFSDWERVPGVLFGHKFWRTSDARNVFNSGRTYDITQ